MLTLADEIRNMTEITVQDSSNETQDALKDDTELHKSVKRILKVIVGLLKDRALATLWVFFNLSGTEALNLEVQSTALKWHFGDPTQRQRRTCEEYKAELEEENYYLRSELKTEVDSKNWRCNNLSDNLGVADLNTIWEIGAGNDGNQIGDLNTAGEFQGKAAAKVGRIGTGVATGTDITLNGT
ncbi:hypothetical protein C1645_819568 [Glomus cerebriforme]|uniref:Uncharacterized protein n=1 Tax=Glomus cerebriforme TaxID=658196 RepID=A0A397TE72_9GLOM|nr:hypothetical protein C1645_819568 [Glomus cerebriforme]